MRNTESTIISLPLELLSKLDEQRGEIPRSRYIRRIIEQYYRYVEYTLNEKDRKISHLEIVIEEIEDQLMRKTRRFNRIENLLPDELFLKYREPLGDKFQ